MTFIRGSLKKSPISQWKLSLHDSMGSGWPIGFMAKKQKKKKLAYRSLNRINYRQDLIWRSEVENLKDQGMIAQIKNKSKKPEVEHAKIQNIQWKVVVT